MSNIIGEPIPRYVIDQINARQTLHGSGARGGTRSDQQINLLNSSTSWIKLASGISVDSTRLANIGITDTNLSGMGLAKRYILHAGFSQLGKSSIDKNQLQQREGFLEQNAKEPTATSSYTYGTYGYSPMPGIISADVKTLNRGSIKKSIVKLVVNNKEQFDIIDLLYLRLGYTVLLEWGNSMYTEDGTNKETVRNTLVEKIFFNKEGKGSYLDMLPPIENQRSLYSGNYDALLGKVSNFSWSFKDDGSYDIEITIISLGDVIESLKTNIPLDKTTRDFIKQTTSTLPTSIPIEGAETEPDPIEENKDANTVSSMLYLWKFLNLTPPTGNEIKIINVNAEYPLGSFLNTTQNGTENISTATTTVEYVLKFTLVEEYTVQKTFEDTQDEFSNNIVF